MMLQTAACTTVTVVMSIPVYGVSATLSLPVVQVESLELSFRPYPSYSGSTSRQVTTLSRLSCTPYYQNAVPRVRAYLNDGSSYTVTSSSTVALADAGSASVAEVVTRSGTKFVVSPVSAGEVEVV